MKVSINGRTQDIIGDSQTIAELLKISKVESPEMVSVQLNGEFIEQLDFANVQVKELDEVDFLYFMGGGEA